MSHVCPDVRSFALMLSGPKPGLSACDATCDTV